MPSSNMIYFFAISPLVMNYKMYIFQAFFKQWYYVAVGNVALLTIDIGHKVA